MQLYPTESYLILSSHSVRWGHQPVVQHLFAQYPTTQYLISDPLCALDEKTLWALREPSTQRALSVNPEVLSNFTIFPLWALREPSTQRALSEQ
ncbi:hypothetical protein, partial [Hydrotalea sp.]|uniref:hypothetical protein n=1 Tax=Hydrotalea sp. TaxID=2881279 RepID=UPI0026046963